MIEMWYNASKETEDLVYYDKELFDILNEKPNNDKVTWRGYHKVYSKYFESIKNESLDILEIGTEFGHGAKALSKYFKNSSVQTIDSKYDYEADMKLRNISNVDYIHEVYGYDVSKIDNTLGDKKYDIIIDDSDHSPLSQYNTIKNMILRIKPNGLYIIEDIRTDRKNAIEYSIRLFDYINLLKSKGVISSFDLYRHDNIVWKDLYKCKNADDVKRNFMKYSINMTLKKCSRILDEYTGCYDNYICVMRVSNV